MPSKNLRGNYISLFPHSQPVNYGFRNSININQRLQVMVPRAAQSTAFKTKRLRNQIYVLATR